MARGGKREGAGRPKGSKNKRLRDVLEAVKATGETPLDYMLRIMRDPTQSERLRADMAKAAASYVHPAFKAIEHTGEGGGPVKVVIDGSDGAL